LSWTETIIGDPQPVDRVEKAVTIRPEWLEPGQSVRITGGPFENFDGTVVELIPDTRCVCILVPMFGGATCVEVDYASVARSE
jgi:transcription antitermination factor NusG